MSHTASFFAIDDVSYETDRVPQDIDVEVSFWNRRGSKVSIIEVAEMRILSRLERLVSPDWKPFVPVELEVGATPEKREFYLIPKDDPNGRVDVSIGELLELRFRPSRGSERSAQPSRPNVAPLQLGDVSPVCILIACVCLSLWR